MFFVIGPLLKCGFLRRMQDLMLCIFHIKNGVVCTALASEKIMLERLAFLGHLM